MKWNKDWDNINPETHKLLNGRILVRMPAITEEAYSKFVKLPEAEIRKMQREMTKGELVRCSQDAFPEDKEKPQIGDMVFFYPYAGNIYLAEDGYLYRNISYKDLTGFESIK